MAKESRHHIEQQDVIWYEPFIDEQSVRRNHGTPTYVNFSQGIAHFTAEYSPNYGEIVYDRYSDGDLGLLGDISVVMYIRPDNYGIGCGLMCKILHNGSFAIGLATDNGPWGGNENCLWSTSDEATFIDAGDDSIALDEWQHIVYTRTAAGVGNFYINGVLTGDADQDSGTPTISDSELAVSEDFYFVGDIDYIVIYKKVLTAEEISNMVNL